MRLTERDRKILKRVCKNIMMKYLAIFFMVGLITFICLQLVERAFIPFYISAILMVYLFICWRELKNPVADILSNEKTMRTGTITDKAEIVKQGFSKQLVSRNSTLSEYYLMVDNKTQLNIEKEQFDRLEIGEEVSMYYATASKNFISLEKNKVI